MKERRYSIHYSPVHARELKDPERLKLRVRELEKMTGERWGSAFLEDGSLELRPIGGVGESRGEGGGIN